MKKVSLLNCSNGVSQSIIRLLTSKGIQVNVGDLYPNYSSIQNFLYFRDSLKAEEQGLIKQNEQMETKSDIRKLAKDSDSVIVVAHNYYSNISSKEKVLQSCIESLSKNQKVIIVNPIEHLHYSQISPVHSIEVLTNQSRAYFPNLIQVQPEILYGQDSSTLHTLVSMIHNKKIKTQSLGQNFFSPLDSEDFSQGIYNILTSDKLSHKDYVFRGQSTHMALEFIEILQQKVDMTVVKKQNVLQALFNSDVEKNAQLMLEKFSLNDFGKGQLKDLNIQAKEFLNTASYQVKKSDQKEGTLQWALYCS